MARNLYKNNEALNIFGDSFCYTDFFNQGLTLSNIIQDTQGRYLGLLCSRGLHAYLGVLASVFSGKAYVPFDLTLTGRQIVDLINDLNCESLLLDEQGLKKIEPYLDELEACSLFSLDSSMSREFISCYDLNSLKDSTDFNLDFSNITPENLLYVLFTSGSTGKPKAVPITHGNLLAYLHQVSKLYPLSQADRCSQAFEFTFDPSVHDMFFTWLSGASLYFMDARARLGAHSFIAKYKITVWNSIPSLLKMLLPLQSFSSEKLSSLRRVMFNGEALPSSVAQSLQEKIPRAQLISFYGLTETTVNMAHYLWHEFSLGECQNGMVPIGEFFSSVDFLIAEMNAEFLVSGEQIFQGYLGNSAAIKAKNAQLFVDVDGVNYLRTGDVLVYKNKVWHYQERIDEQVKIQGHRVDLNEIQSKLEALSGELSSLVVMYEDESGLQKLAGFIQNEQCDSVCTQQLLEKLNQDLPNYTQLDNIYCLASYPYRSSGKIDKASLRKYLLNHS